MSGGLDRRLWAISSVVILGAVMSILDTTIVNVAIDTLGRDLHAPLGDDPVGLDRLHAGARDRHPADGLGRGAVRHEAAVHARREPVPRRLGAVRPRVVVGALIAFRVLQGLGGGMIMPVGMIDPGAGRRPAADGPRDERDRRADAARAGHRSGPRRLARRRRLWRWIFFVNIPVGAVALVLAARILDRDEPQERHRLDLRRVRAPLAGPGGARLRPRRAARQRRLG